MMKNKLIITSDENKIISSLFKDRDMIQVSVDFINQNSILGNIYIGKVKNIIKNINAAFVEISNGLICYYALNNDVLPIMANSSNKIKIGDELLVQVLKESIKSKSPLVSSKIELTGKYAILIYGKSIVSVSSKITNIDEKNRLKNIAELYVNDDYGFIIRTNAENIDENKIKNEIEYLIETFNQIKKYSIYKSCFSLIYEAPASYICDIRDSYSELIDDFITDDTEIYNKVYDYLSVYQKEDLKKLSLYKDDLLSLNSFYGVKTKLENALKPTVWLKSGASIIIQHTEALTVIDVNTGKAIKGKKAAEETFLKINLEAAKEIAKQIRLRNLSGIIIIDFIDMKSKDDEENLMNELEKYLRKDPIKTTLVSMTALGLVEITRKKIRRPLYEQLNS